MSGCYYTILHLVPRGQNVSVARTFGNLYRLYLDSGLIPWDRKVFLLPAFAYNAIKSPGSACCDATAVLNRFLLLLFLPPIFSFLRLCQLQLLNPFPTMPDSSKKVCLTGAGVEPRKHDGRPCVSGYLTLTGYASQWQ